MVKRRIPDPDIRVQFLCFLKDTNMKSLILISLIAFLFGCSPKSKERYIIQSDISYSCSDKDKLANSILECVKNANPQSDEEPEDWVSECSKRMKQVYCNLDSAYKIWDTEYRIYYHCSNDDIPVAARKKCNLTRADSSEGRARGF